MRRGGQVFFSSWRPKEYQRGVDAMSSFKAGDQRERKEGRPCLIFSFMIWLLCNRGNFFLYIFWRSRVCWPLLCLCRPFCIFERCLDSNQRITLINSLTHIHRDTSTPPFPPLPAALSCYTHRTLSLTTSLCFVLFLPRRGRGCLYFAFESWGNDIK